MFRARRDHEAELVISPTGLVGHLIDILPRLGNAVKLLTESFPASGSIADCARRDAGLLHHSRIMGWVVGDWLGQELILAEDGQGIHWQNFGQVVRAAQEVFAPCFVVPRPEYGLPP